MSRACLCLLLMAVVLRCEPAPVKAADAWKPQQARSTGGILGERLKLWRERRMWRVASDPIFIAPFERHAPSPTPAVRGGQGESAKHSLLWQGEHIGKWLHSAAMAYEQTRDPKIPDAARGYIGRLLAAQQPNGYLGTYEPHKRFYAPPDNDTRYSWDIWTQRYNIYGLLSWERHHPDAAAVRACVRMGDLLLDTYGPGKRDMTLVGTRSGMSSGTLLESIAMLYGRTGEPRFLEFARHIVRMSEDNPRFRLLTAMLERKDVSVPGDGKAYQLMAVLLGYLELYRYTGEPQWLKAAVNGWENIRAGHLYETGGPWTFAHVKEKNKECFAPPELFDPAHPVEVCSVTTWVQLSLALLRATGEARYANEAERAVLNQVLASQSPDGISWTTHPSANTADRNYVDNVNCCASSGPRAMELLPSHVVGMSRDAVSIASYAPVTVEIPERRMRVTIRGDYPFADRATIVFDMPKPQRFALDLALPAGATALRTNGRTERLATGFYRLTRMWRPGEQVEVSFDFPVIAHVRQGRDGKRWVAFTRGPVVLAAESPFEVSGTGDPAALVAGGKLKGGPALVPYFRAGAPKGPVYTYFPVR